MNQSIDFCVVDSPEKERLVHQLAGKHIVGYNYPGESWAKNQQRQLDRVFNGHGPTPRPQVIAATTPSSSKILGAAVLEPPDPSGFADAASARDYFRLHVVLAALFVLEEMQGKGIGRQLMNAVGQNALQAGARFIDGFVDDRNPSRDFYQRIGAQVMPHNTGLSPRFPTNVPQIHAPGANGHWFRFDLWQMYQVLCCQCGNQLTFDAAKDRLVCPNCGL